MNTRTRPRATSARYRPLSHLRGAAQNALHEGAPLFVLAGVAIAALLGLLLVAATAGRPAVRGFAEFRAVDRDCSLVKGRTLNALRCTYVARNVYEIEFTRDVSGSAPVASRSTCCPGQIAAALAGRRTVRISLARQRTYPVVAQVVVP